MLLNLKLDEESVTRFVFRAYLAFAYILLYSYVSAYPACIMGGRDYESILFKHNILIVMILSFRTDNSASGKPRGQLFPIIRLSDYPKQIGQTEKWTIDGNDNKTRYEQIFMSLAEVML